MNCLLLEIIASLNVFADLLFTFDLQLFVHGCLHLDIVHQSFFHLCNLLLDVRSSDCDLLKLVLSWHVVFLRFFYLPPELVAVLEVHCLDLFVNLKDSIDKQENPFSLFNQLIPDVTQPDVISVLIKIVSWLEVDDCVLEDAKHFEEFDMAWVFGMQDLLLDLELRNRIWWVLVVLRYLPYLLFYFHFLLNDFWAFSGKRRDAFFDSVFLRHHFLGLDVEPREELVQLVPLAVLDCCVIVTILACLWQGQEVLYSSGFWYIRAKDEVGVENGACSIQLLVEAQTQLVDRNDACLGKAVVLIKVSLQVDYVIRQILCLVLFS